MVIQIQIGNDTWKHLNDEKKPGETFDEVLKRKLKIQDLNKKGGKLK